MKASLATICVLALICSAAALDIAKQSSHAQLIKNEIISNQVQKQSSNFDILLFIRRLLFSIGKQHIWGFTDAYEKTSGPLPENCMDDEFQKTIVELLHEMIDAIYTSVHSLYDLVYTVYIFSIIMITFFVNHIKTVCNSTKFFEDLWNFLLNTMSLGILEGLIKIIETFAINILNNPIDFIKWNIILKTSMMSFQEYYVGYSAGKIWRILLAE